MAYGAGWRGREGGGVMSRFGCRAVFFGARFWNTMACFAVAAESGHFLFRLNVSAMDAHAFEVSFSPAFVLLLRLACVPPQTVPGIWTIILTFSASFHVEILCLSSHCLLPLIPMCFTSLTDFACVRLVTFARLVGLRQFPAPIPRNRG